MSDSIVNRSKFIPPFLLDVPEDYGKRVLSQIQALTFIGQNHPFAHNLHNFALDGRATLAVATDWKLKKRSSFAESRRQLLFLPRDLSAQNTLDAYFADFMKWRRAFFESPLLTFDIAGDNPRVLQELIEGLDILEEHPIDFDFVLASVEQAANVFDLLSPKPQQKKPGSSAGFGGKGRQWIYFVQLEGQPKLKIGITTDVNARIAQLQTASPYQLKLVAVIAGTAATEKSYHRRFKQYRTSGEWFDLAGDLKKFVNSLLCLSDEDEAS